MSKETKTRNTVKNIKFLDKAASGSAHIKNAFIRSLQAAETTQDSGYHSSGGYAADHVMDSAKGLAQGAARRLKHPHKKVTENVSKAGEQFRKVRQQMPKARKEATEKAKRTANHTKKTVDTLANKAEQAQKAAQHAQKPLREAKYTLQQTRQAGKQTIHTVQQRVKSARQAGQAATTANATAKGAIKTVKKSIKTGERTVKATVKTAQKTAKATEKSAKAAAKAAKVAARASREAAKAAAQTAKLAARAIAAMVKAAMAAIKGLIALIAAGGWGAVLIIIIICLIGLLVGSIFGVFFSGEDSGNGYTMPMAIQEIDAEYTGKINEIRNSNAHDEVSMSGSRATWKDILAVYAVKINTDPENAQDVATMDEQKKELLSAFFGDMNTITHRTESVTYTETIVTDDGAGNIVESQENVTKTVLYITISSKSAIEMAEQYGFSEQQKAQLAELLSYQYADLWSAVLYGVHNGSSDIVAVAISQIGNVGGEPYWSWYGFNSRVAWCACFVTWCANECGYTNAGIIPVFASCQSQGIPWFKERNLWQDSSYVPAPGDLIFFDWAQDGVSDHVGIVEYVEGEYVHTVEGNTSNSCARRSYRLDSRSIVGYGTPMY